MANLGGDAATGTRANSRAKSAVSMGLDIHNVYVFECFGADGALKWRDEVTNLVTTEGKNDLLTNYFKGSAYTGTFFVGLASGATPNFQAADTSAQNGGTNSWTEFVAYSQGTRPAWTGGTASGGSIDNSASQAVFTINGAGGTVGGAFLATVSTKGGTTGKIYGAAQLSSSRTLASGDTLNISVTLTV